MRLKIGVWNTTKNILETIGEYLSEGAAREWSTVVDISMTPPSFKPRENVFFKFESLSCHYNSCNYCYSEWSTVVDIYIPFPSFKPVLLLLSRSSLIF